MQNEISPDEIEHILKNRIPKPIGKYLHASVMVLLFPVNGRLHILFSKRSLQLKHQPGDICFPGGRQEGNETPLETALRETWEELGIPSHCIQVLGQTDYIITTAGAIVTPFVGYVRNVSIDDIPFNSDEVEDIFTVPISYFKETEPEIHYLYLQPTTEDDFPYEYIFGGKEYPFARPKVPELFYHYCGKVIWGMTAMITHHVVNLLYPSNASQNF
ncbi:MAG: CoA pyrophosphatase [Epulopiscium sp.]|jgi:coenzyme A diphosphatase NUDT7|nr:CoA pyrophosphatase [Candidatus Epulonipiscium sp.]